MERANSSTKLKDSKALIDESDRQYNEKLETHMTDTLQSSLLKKLSG